MGNDTGANETKDRTERKGDRAKNKESGREREKERERESRRRRRRRRRLVLCGNW